MQGHNKTCILLSRVMPLREPDAGPNLASHFRSLGSCLGASIPRTLSMNHSSERHRFITRQHMAWCSISLKLRFARQTPIRRRCPRDPPSPFEELIPFSSRASILFLLEDVKLARLILSYAVFLLRSYAWESQPGDSLRTVYLYSIPWHSGPPCLVAISYLYSTLVTWDQVDKSLLSLVGARLHYKSTFNA